MSLPRRARALASAAVAVVVGAALVACAPPSGTGSGSTPQPAPPATTAPPTTIPDTDESAPNESLADEILLSRDGFVIVDAESADLFRYTWIADPAPAIEALEEAFGTEPIITVIAGDGTHFPDYTTYTWGGFTFFDWVDTGEKARDEYPLPAFVQMVTAEVNGVSLTTDVGLIVGSAEVDVQDREPTFHFPGFESGEEYFFLDAPPTDPSLAGGPAIRVVVDGAVVTEIGYTYWSNL